MPPRTAPSSLLLSVLSLLIFTPMLPAQGPTPACAEPERRHFDFWIGRWTVSTTGNGQVAGENEIVAIAGGCALLENWRSAAGGTGKSINTWRAADRRWTQHWVDGQGTVLDLSGGLRDGKMVLEGAARTTPQGTVRDRITWTPVGPDEVRQVWDISSDDGASWRTIFDGTYRRK